MSKADERKIVEIYVTEDKEEDTISFNFIKKEDTHIANQTMKALLMMFSTYKNSEDEIEVKYEEPEVY